MIKKENFLQIYCVFWLTILNFHFLVCLLYYLFYLKAGKNIHARAAATGKQVQVNPICSSTILFILVIGKSVVTLGKIIWLIFVLIA